MHHAKLANALAVNSVSWFKRKLNNDQNGPKVLRELTKKYMGATEPWLDGKFDIPGLFFSN